MTPRGVHSRGLALILGGSLLIVSIAVFLLANPSEPILYLPLRGQPEDPKNPPQARRSVDIVLSSAGATFDGINSHLEIAHGPDLSLGRADFTISLWLRSDGPDCDSIGDLLSKYSEQEMKGVLLSIDSRPGMTTTQANFRNLFFGIQGGLKSPSAWKDEGQPGQARQISAMAVFDGELYVGTLEFGSNGGRVYRYRGVSDWEDMQFPAAGNSVSSLADFKGRLCAGSSQYRWGSYGVRDPETYLSENDTAAGKVYCFNPDTREWEFEGQPDERRPFGTIGSSTPAVIALTVYRGELYAASGYHLGVYRRLGDKKWEWVGSPQFDALKPPEVRVQALGIWQGRLYAALNDSGGVARYEGNEKWTNLGGLHAFQQYSLSTYRNELAVGTFDTGEVFTYSNQGKWSKLGRLGKQDEVMALTVYNGNLYGGSLPDGEVYRYDGNNKWTLLTVLDRSPGPIGTRAEGYADGIVKRVWNFAVYRGRLFAGTLPSGKVYSTMIGQAVSEDRALPPGWQFITAVREKTRLKLYRNGSLVGETVADGILDVGNSVPLLIGKGMTKSLNGELRDIRIYGRALHEDEIIALYRAGSNEG